MWALCVQGPKCTGHTRSPKKVQWDLHVSGRGLEERDMHRAPVTDACVMGHSRDHARMPACDTHTLLTHVGLG